MYPRNILLPLYNHILRLSRKRGEHTLAKMDTFFFKCYREVIMSSSPKVSITVPPKPEYFRCLLKIDEAHIKYAISKLIATGDTFVDVGANIGYVAAHALSVVGKQGKVYCLEPESKNFHNLQSNCESLNQEGFNITAYNVAASSSNTTSRLCVHRISQYCALEDEKYRLEQVEGIQIVNLVRLSDWASANHINIINLLKVDVEGHEIEVLRGAMELFANGIVKNVLLECRQAHICDFIDAFCQDFGLYQWVWDGKIWLNRNLKSVNYKTDCLLSTEPVTL